MVVGQLQRLTGICQGIQHSFPNMEERGSGQSSFIKGDYVLVFVLTFSLDSEEALRRGEVV